jgi:O-methyltransferase
MNMLSAFDAAFARALPVELHGPRARLQLPRTRAFGLWKAALSALPLPGEFWECGVYKGGSARLLAELLRTYPRPLRLFDTFNGFANVGPQDRAEVENGRMFYLEDAVEDVRRFVDADFAVFHPGAIPDGFAGLHDTRIAFANVDVDLYQPTREALAFIAPRMMEGGTIIIDDYGDPDWPGVREAALEVFGQEKFPVEGTQARITF